MREGPSVGLWAWPLANRSLVGAVRWEGFHSSPHRLLEGRLTLQGTPKATATEGHCWARRQHNIAGPERTVGVRCHCGADRPPERLQEPSDGRLLGSRTELTRRHKPKRPSAVLWLKQESACKE